MNPPESIFRTAAKTFFRLFFGTIALCLAFVFFSFVYGILASAPMIEDKTTIVIQPDVKGKRETLSATSPVILQIPIHGVIGDPKQLNLSILSDVLLDSRSGLFINDRVKGILLTFNTPGGSAIESDAIYRLLSEYKTQYKVPIVGYVEGLCASGGMYIASSADELFSSPVGIIGSVGVISGPFFNFYDFMQKMGVQAKTLTQGLDKDEFNPLRPWKPNEGAPMEALMGYLYNLFVDVVVENRPRLDRQKLVNEYGAKIFNCVEAEKFGYIDHAMSSRNAALLSLLNKAGINPENTYHVVTLTPKHSLVKELFSGKSPLLSGKIEHEIVPFEVKLRQEPCYLYSPHE